MARHNLIVFLLASVAVACGGKAGNETSAPATPYGLSCTQVSDSELRLSWDGPSENVEGWWVFLRKDTDGFYVEPLNYSSPLPAVQREYVFSGLSEDHAYDLGVQALGASANSEVQYLRGAAIVLDPGEVPEESTDPGVSADPEPSEFAVTVDTDAMSVTFVADATSGEKLSIGLAPCSANKTVQIASYSIGNESFTSYTDWVGPWHMRTIASTSQTGNAWGFTGGWHASNGDASGNPTAVTDRIEVTVDGAEAASGTYTAKEATCTVYNRIEAANTKFNDAKRYVLEETVTYRFHGGRLYVTMEAKALEDLNVMIYYGMQIAGGFSEKFAFTTEDGETGETTTNYFAKGKVRDMTGWSKGGHSVTAHMYDEGLGEFKQCTKAYSALAQYYGPGNGKGYYMLIGDKDASTANYTFKQGTTLHWSGYYEFR